MTPSSSSWCSTPWEWLRPSRQGVQHHRSNSVSIYMVFNTIGVTPSPFPWCSTRWEWLRYHLQDFRVTAFPFSWGRSHSHYVEHPEDGNEVRPWNAAEPPRSAREHFTECSSPNGSNQEDFVMLHAEINGAQFLIIWFIATARRRKNFQSTCQFNVRFSSQIYLFFNHVSFKTRD